MSASGEGLRALKKERTRRDIVVATLELTLEDSYRATTIPLIAERAMVSPRTVSAYFPNKDKIAFDGMATMLSDLETRLAETDVPLVDRLGSWIHERDPREKEITDLRMRALTADPDLRLVEHRYLEHFAAAVARAAATEIGAEPGDPGPQTFAAAFLGVILSLRNRLVKGEEPVGDPKDFLEAGFTFLEAGLAALKASGSPS
jgi:AcrR family transcriptional regulator